MLNKKVMSVGLVLCLLALTGCQSQSGAGGGQPQPKPPAAAKTPPKNPGGQQPAPIEGDPGAHNTQPGEVDLHVDWVSENSKSPACEWSKNGVVQPCANIAKAKKESGMQDYIGFWEYGQTGKAGDVFTVNAQGNIGIKSIDCTIFWKGAYHGGITNGRRCGITLKLN